MAVFIALKLCPGLRIVDHHFDRYRHFSQIVKAIFAKYDPNYTSFGLDEASMDVTEFLKYDPGSAEEIAAQIQREVTEATRLTISIGIAPNSRLAKIAADINKPNGCYVLPGKKEDVLKFMSQLPLRKIPGVGGVRERILQELGFHIGQDIIDRREIVWHLFSEKFREFIFSAVLGVSIETFSESDQPQSISKEETFDETDSTAELSDRVVRMSECISRELNKKQLVCRNVGIKMKFANFRIASRSTSFDDATSNADEIANVALKLLIEHQKTNKMKMRLIGVRASTLRSFSRSGVQRRLGECVSARPRTALASEVPDPPEKPKPRGIEQWVARGTDADEVIAAAARGGATQRDIGEWAVPCPPSPPTKEKEKKQQPRSKPISAFFAPQSAVVRR
jgi:DNA polymerase kappa